MNVKNKVILINLKGRNFHNKKLGVLRKKFSRVETERHVSQKFSRIKAIGKSSEKK